MKGKRRNPRRKTRRKVKKRRGGANHGERKTRRRNEQAELDCWCSPDDNSVLPPIPQAHLPSIPVEPPQVPQLRDEAKQELDRMSEAE